MEGNGESTQLTSAFDSETFGQDTSFHLDQPVGSMSISPSGRDVVLASRNGLDVIDLDSPYSPPRHLSHSTSWEVADVQWSPFALRDYWVVSTSNQKALVWNLGMSSPQDCIEFVLHGHTRAITDINFSAHNPDVLATCAVDSYVHVWDLRTPMRPSVSFSDWFAGATQVKWSRQDAHVVASSHDKYLRIWDDRMGAYPVRSIKAHNTKIYGIDWNRFHPNKIATSSLDRTIKFWNCNNLEDKPEGVVRASFPVWRARHTPFGWGILAMPQRGNSDLHLYDRRAVPKDNFEDITTPVAQFPGHKGQVKEFLWRARGSIVEGVDHRDFQLVSWGTDRVLRLHQVDTETFRNIGYEKGISQVQRLNFTRRGARYISFRDALQRRTDSDVFGTQTGSSPSEEPAPALRFRPRANTGVGMSKVRIANNRASARSGSNKARTGMHGREQRNEQMSAISWMKNVRIAAWDQDSLGEEIRQIGEKFPKVEFEAIDMVHRKASITLYAPWKEDGDAVYMRFDMRFPKAYPQRAPADVKLQKTTDVSDDLVAELSAGLHNISTTHMSNGRGCIEAVLRYVLREQELDQVLHSASEAPLAQSSILTDPEDPESLSSDDEDAKSADGQGGTGPLRSPDMLAANARVPVPKGCGALWSDTGKLVCFFPSRPIESVSILDSLANGDGRGVQSNKLFAGFGRLHTKSPGRVLMSEKRDRDDDEDSVASDTSTASSSSSPTSEMLTSVPNDILPLRAWRGTEVEVQRSRSTDRSNRSVNGFGHSKSTATLPTNVVSIRACDDLLPSTFALASDYKVIGESHSLCKHNASVARKFNRPDTAHVWELMALIVSNGVPLECITVSGQSHDIVAVAKGATSRLRRPDSGVDLSHDEKHHCQVTDVQHRVKWGQSPLAGRYLIAATFNYFDTLGDIQMLAMLSCVLAEPPSTQPTHQVRSREPANSRAATWYPSSTIRYFPSLAVALSVVGTFHQGHSPMSHTGRQQQSLAISSTQDGLSTDSTNEKHGPEPSVPTAREAPPLEGVYLPGGLRRSSRVSVSGSIPHQDGGSSAAVSLSTSPEGLRHSQPSGSTLPFSISRASLRELAQSYSSSPPWTTTSSSSKKHSPAESISNKQSTPPDLTSLASKRADSADFRRSNKFPNSSFQSRSIPSNVTETSEYRLGRRFNRENSRVSNQTLTNDLKKPRRRVRYTTGLHNQSDFNNDGHVTTPLLDPDLEWRYQAYRAGYAHILGSWGKYTEQAEILKFDGLSSSPIPSHGPRRNLSMAGGTELGLADLPYRQRLSAGRSSETCGQLSLRRRCLSCAEVLLPIEKNGQPIGWHCLTNGCEPAGRAYRASCMICQTALTNLMVPCLWCGHVTCVPCADDWFGRRPRNPTQNIQVCPSGCGCSCSLQDQGYVCPLNDQEEYDAEAVGTLDEAKSNRSIRSERLLSVNGPDTALGAFLSLSRTHAISTGKELSSRRGLAMDTESLYGNTDHQVGTEMDTGQWAPGVVGGLEPGMGKNLKNKASDVTIRQNQDG